MDSKPCCKRCKNINRPLPWIIGKDRYCQRCFDWTIENTDVDFRDAHRLTDNAESFEYPYDRKVRSGVAARALTAVPH